MTAFAVILLFSGNVFLKDIEFAFCNSPTQPQHEMELDIIMGRNSPTPPPTGTFKALTGNIGPTNSPIYIFTPAKADPG
jgi:hypothetical protein